MRAKMCIYLPLFVYSSFSVSNTYLFLGPMRTYLTDLEFSVLTPSVILTRSRHRVFFLFSALVKNIPHSVSALDVLFPEGSILRVMSDCLLDSSSPSWPRFKCPSPRMVFQDGSSYLNSTLTPYSLYPGITSSAVVIILPNNPFFP